MRFSLVALLGLLLLVPPGQQEDERVRRIFQEAQRYAEEGDMEGALREYERLVAAFPDADLADDALLHVADGLWRMGDAAAATQTIARLHEQYQGTPGAAGGYLLEGNIWEATANGPDDLQEALAAFRTVSLLYGRQEFPDLEWRAQGLVRAGEISVLLGEPGDAQAAFLSAIEDEPPSIWTRRAQLGLATTLLRSGQWVPAAEILQEIINTGADSDSDPVVAAARRRLELGYRMLLRPLLGQLPWSDARRMQLSGTPLKDPIGVDAGEDNRIIVADEGIPQVGVYNPDGSVAFQRRAEDVRHPWWDQGLIPYAVTKRGIVLAAASRDRQGFSVPNDDNELKPLDQILAATRGIYRQWLVLDDNGDRALLFNETNEYRTALIDDDQSQPVDVDVDYRGRIYVLDRRAAAVVRFSADAATKEELFNRRDWRRPEAIAIGELGHLYVLDRDAKKVEVFNSTGRVLWELGPDLFGIELRSPRDIGVDGSGRIYIADRDLKMILVVE